MMNVEVSRLRPIKMLVLDVDGVLTDCRIFLGSDGEWKRFFSIRDGYGLRMLMEAGYKTAIITGSKAKDIRERARVLGIHFFYEGNLDKKASFEQLKKDSGMVVSEMAYMGDDVFDMPVMEKVGFAATVPEAMDEVKKISHYITHRPGGNGAVREVCDFIIRFGAYAKGDS